MGAIRSRSSRIEIDVLFDDGFSPVEAHVVRDNNKNIWNKEDRVRMPVRMPHFKEDQVVEEIVRVPSELRALRYKNGWVNKDSPRWT